MAYYTIPTASVTIPANAGGLAGTTAVGNITLTGTYSTTSPYVISNGTGYNTWSSGSIGTGVDISSKQMSCPEGYDIKLGNLSVKQTLESINSWLPYLKPNPKLEADFEQLKALRDQYEALEKELKEKAEVWSILKDE
jgi:hypothetical protein